ncbi:MAG TPA: hypothetical protein DCR96_07440, partial [Hyphomonas sp.]|nr:hypothetical protein [Hyphomonas sp.]
MAVSAIQPRYRPTSRKPGISAPANKSPTDTTNDPAEPVAWLAWLAAFEIASASRIRTMEGGMI